MRKGWKHKPVMATTRNIVATLEIGKNCVRSIKMEGGKKNINVNAKD
jgi:hypothetical protein